MAGMRSRHRYRCRECRRNKRYPHFTLRRGTKRIKCPSCKSYDVYDIEAAYRKAQENRQAKRNVCYCHGVPHPHGKGSHRMCVHHELADVPLTYDEEMWWQEVEMNPTRTASR